MWLTNLHHKDQADTTVQDVHEENEALEESHSSLIDNISDHIAYRRGQRLDTGHACEYCTCNTNHTVEVSHG